MMKTLAELNDLTKLSTLDLSTWAGRKVYHPMTQIGDVPYWRDGDLPDDYPGKGLDAEDDDYDPNRVIYDEGIVTLVVEDTRFPDDPAMWHVTLQDGDSRLTYRAHNLWAKEEGQR